MTRYLIIAALALAGCGETNQTQAPVAANTEPRIIGGEIDFETNTFTDERTGKVYSLSEG